jgi:hypothetical protein
LENPLADAWRKAPLGDDVNSATEELLDLIAKLDEGEPPLPWNVLNEQIDVAALACLASGD